MTLCFNNFDRNTVNKAC